MLKFLFLFLFVAIPSGGAGVFIGSLIIYFTKSKGRNVALINWVVTLVALFPTFIFLLSCPTVELVGVTVEYPDRYKETRLLMYKFTTNFFQYSSIAPTSTSFLNASCIQSCNCESTKYVPICGEDGFTYFTPCTAGCRTKITNSDTMVLLSGVHSTSGDCMLHTLLGLQYHNILSTFR